MSNIHEDGVLFVDEKFFGDKMEHEYDCICKDGIATGTRVNDNNEDEPLSIIIEYPSLSNLTEEEKDRILSYRGLYNLGYDGINYGDVMVAYGKIKY